MPGLTWVRPASQMSSVGSPASWARRTTSGQLRAVRHLEHDLGLALLQPGRQVGAAEAGQDGGNGRVGDLGGDLPASHAEVRPDHDRQFLRHQDTVRPTASQQAQPNKVSRNGLPNTELGS